MAKKRTKKTGKKRARRNPLSAEKSQRFETKSYPHYVGSIITPKIKAPVSVWVGKTSDVFLVTTPNQEYLIGSGYYGDHEGPLNCTRQHMLPGLLDEEDRGTGLGTSLYVAGNMVVAAAEDAGGNFPWRMSSSRCTYSIEGDRSSDADRAWRTMRRHGLAEQVEDETEGDEDFDDEVDASDYIDEYSVTESYEGREDGISVSDVDIRGTIRIRGTKTGTVTQEIDVMQFEEIRNSGLVLELSDYFDDPTDFKWVPPEVFGSLKWAQTPDDVFVRFAESNTPSEEMKVDWIRAAACALIAQGDEYRAELLLRTIGEQRQLAMFEDAVANPRRRNPDVCPTIFRKDSRAWEKQWGEDFDASGELEIEVQSPRKKTKRKTKAKRSRKTNPRPTDIAWQQQVASRLARGG